MPEYFYDDKIKPHLAMLFKLCRAYSENKADFDDLMQEVCLQVFISREGYQGNAKWSTWLYRVALNVCLTFKRNQKETLSLEEDGVTGHVLDSSAEALDLLYKGLKRLSPVDRALLVMYLEGFSYDEIALVVGGKPNNLAVRVKRLKEKVAKELA